jgi:RNA polymerase sigma-70 factor (ECF subfamily)
LHSERDLTEKAKVDPKVFGELYELYYPKIFGYIYRITVDYSMACDISSETFLKAWIKIGGFQWRGISISSWLFRIATNELNQYFRRKKYTPHMVAELSIFDREALSRPGYFSEAGNETITRMEKAEEFRELHRRLTTLPPKYQKVIALRYFENMSIREISEILSWKEGTVKSLISRGLDKLKNIC